MGAVIGVLFQTINIEEIFWEEYSSKLGDSKSNMEGNVAELERRYQALLNDFQAGKLDQATFVAEVDRLQFIDDWGRYWMLGAQSGDWHYYDGQAWHQADPRDADKLPFMDDQGRYWQRGVKSGEWYYYDANIDEWVKPEKDDPATPTPVQGRQWQTPPLSQSYNSPTVQPVADTPPQSQFGADLFQDDEGRYWAIGAKTQQWYFYDADGWHPAHEFQVRAPAQSSPYSYSPQAPIYQPQPSQPYPAPPSQPYHPPAYVPQPQPTYNYTIPPVENRQAPMEQPAQPAPGQAPPPQAPSQSGNWYYFDGNQWLKYSSGEPAKETPPDPKLIIEQEATSSKQKAEVKAEAKEEKVVAEFFEETEPPVEVVDVEVITVVEAEPDEEPQPKSTPAPSPAGQPTPPLPRRADEVRPKRSKTGSLEPAARRLDSEEAVEVPPRRRDASRPVTPTRTTTPDPSRLITPRKKAAQEPTVIIPATSSREPSPASTTIARPSRPVPIDRRRTAREDTLPMAPVSGAKPMEPAATPPVSERHRQVTQPLPKVAPTPNPRPGTPVPQVQPTVRDRVTPVVAPTTTAPTQAEPEPEGYTFGDVLRSFPSTLWTGIAGVVVMLIFAILIIVGVTYGSNFFGIDTIAAVPSPTPTLDAGLAPDSTPTPGPTTDAPNSPIAAPAPASMAIFSSPELGFTLEYPENWPTDETPSIAVFSPSNQGLDLEQMNDTNLRIGIVEDNASISDLLTDALAAFPADAETLNEGTISIASQTWTSTQIRFEDENLGGQGIATIAVTNKDGQGYYLIAVASAEEWNSVQPVFQGMINSFKFGAEEVVAQATARTTPQAGQATPATPADEADDESGSEEEEAGPTPTPTPRATPTPEATPTPLVYRVQPGDTLLGIAVRFGVDMDLLAQENGIANPEGLQIDQELIIPFTAEELAAYNAGITGNNRTSAPATAGEEEASANEAETTAPAGETAAAPAPQPTAPAPAREAPPAPAAPVSGRIVYPAFNPSLNSYDVWMVDLATGEQTPIAGNASQPDFNRDGTLLAYRSWERSTRGIFFRDFVGGRGGMVTRFVEDGLPSWSPDGYSFAFASRKEGDRVPRVYIGNQSGEDTFSIGFQGEYVDTFPDGRLIVKGCTPSGDCGLFIIGARGGGEKKISGEGADTAPAVSPDGSKIAFMSSGRGGNNWEIWVMNADGSNPQRLTENGNNDGLPTWSPDGQSIAYVSDQGGAWSVWVMNADGSNQRKLFAMKGSPDGKVFHDESNSKGWLEERISWAP